MRLLKWAGIALAGVMALVVVVAGVVYFKSESRLNHVWDVNPPAVTAAQFTGGSGMEAGGSVASSMAVRARDGMGMDDGGAMSDAEGEGMAPADPGADPGAELVEWGAHIAETRGCKDCHTPDLGGGLFVDAGPVMRVSASNLTPGGVGATYTDQDFVRAIRHGIRPDGTALKIMPSYEYYYLSDSDLAALIAYLRSVPAVQRGVEKNAVGPVGRALMVTGKLPILAAEMIDHDAPRPVAPAPGATVAYGEYLTRGCTGCHGETFSGGVIPVAPPEWPPAANITQDPETGIGSWTKEQFVTAFTTGMRPDGRQLQPQFMPWVNFSQFEPYEVEAIWMYMKTVPAKAYGGR